MRLIRKKARRGGITGSRAVSGESLVKWLSYKEKIKKLGWEASGCCVAPNTNAHNQVVLVDTNNAGTKGTSDYDALNNSAPNTRYELDNGTTFKTNESGRLDEVTFTPLDQKVLRDGRQTAVCKEGLPDDVGCHVQACSMGGTCRRFNLFPQNKNFNNGEYKKWEYEIRNSLKNGDDVSPVTVRFDRADPSSARPYAIDIEYTINGQVHTREFLNQPGG